jgi:hypothetical protein
MSQSEKKERVFERIEGSISRAWEKFKRRCPFAASIIVYVGVLLTGRLKPHHALARLSVVALIELVGVLLTFWLIQDLPLRFDVNYAAYWQDDCLKLAHVLLWMGIGLVCASLLGYLTFSSRYFAIFGPAIAEAGILITFVLNIAYFSFAMMRTGGPAHSFFAQLVPMQLSGILILEQQRMMMTSRRLSPRWRAFIYAVFTILVWIIVVWSGERVQSFFGWSAMMIDRSRDDYEIWAAAILFVLGIIVTAVAYWGTPLLAACMRRKQMKTAG